MADMYYSPTVNLQCRHGQWCCIAGSRLTTVAVVRNVTQTEAILAAAEDSASGRSQASPLRLWPLAQLRPGAGPPSRQQLREAGCQDGVSAVAVFPAVEAPDCSCA